jgi:hypothetical protein
MSSEIVTPRRNRLRSYWPGLVLPNGCKLIECLGRMASNRHYYWAVECTCGARFKAGNNQFIRTTLCPVCTERKMSQSTWSAGSLIPGGRILDLHSKTKDHRQRWRCLCDCGEEYLATTRQFTEKHRRGCVSCSGKWWQAEKETKSCPLCEGLSWRVKGIRCKGKGCGLRFAHEEPLRVEQFGGLRSSAGRAVDAGLEKGGS